MGHDTFICSPTEAVFRADLQENKLPILAFAPPRNHWELSRSVRCCKEEELTFSGNMQSRVRLSSVSQKSFDMPFFFAGVVRFAWLLLP